MKKKYTYPVVLYYDKEFEVYTVAIHDLNIFTESETVEEAFIEAKERTEVFFGFLDETKEDIVTGSKYIDVYYENKNENIVILIDVENDG